MAGDVSLQALKRQTFLGDRPAADEGTVIAGQDYNSVYFTGGTISGIDLSDSLVKATGSSVEISLAYRFAQRLNVKDYGALGDGVTDDTAAIQSAINTAVLLGAVCYFPEGTYVISSSLNATNASLFIGLDATIDMSSCPSGTVGISCSGTQGNYFSLTANAAKGDLSIFIDAGSLSSSGIVAGDWIDVKSDTIFDSGRTSSKIGEIILVKSVDVVTGEIELSEPLQDAYTTAASAKVARLSLAEKFIVTGGGTIKSNNDINKSHIGIQAFCAISPEVFNLNFKNIDFAGLRFWHCVNPVGDNLTFRDFTTNVTGYGISIGGSTRDARMTNLYGKSVRHLFTTNNSNTVSGTVSYVGIPRRIYFDGFIALDSSFASGGSMSGGDAVDTHAAAEDIHIWNGQIFNSSLQGVNFECVSGSIRNIYIDGAISNGVSVVNRTDRNGRIVVSDIICKNIVAGESAGQAVRINTITQPYETVQVSNIVAENCDSIAVWVSGTASYLAKQVNVTNVMATGIGGHGAYIEYAESCNLTNIMSYKPTDAKYAAVVSDVSSGVVDNISFVAPDSTNGGGCVLVDNASTKVVVGAYTVKATTPVLLYGVFLSDTSSNVTVLPARGTTDATVDVRAGTSLTNKLFETWNGSVVAAGSTSADATLLNGCQYQEIVTVGSGEGVRLPVMLGLTQTVYNRGANTLLVYPPTGSRWGAASIDAGHSITAGSAASFSQKTSTQGYVT